MLDVNLYHADCLQKMQEISDGSIDLICADLPYGTTRNNWDSVLPLEDYVRLTEKELAYLRKTDKAYTLVSGEKALTKSGFISLCNRANICLSEDIDWLFSNRKEPGIWTSYERIIKDNGAILLFADGMFMANLMASNAKLWRYNLVWDKVLPSGFLNSGKMPLRRTEEIVVFYKKPPVYNPQKTQGQENHSKGFAIGKLSHDIHDNHDYGKYTIVDNHERDGSLKHPTSLLSFQKTHPSKMVHPTQKPVKLLQWLVKTYSNPGDTILDNCMGCGSTGLACIETGRNFIGMEWDDQYFYGARDRLCDALYNLKQEGVV